MHPRRAVPGLVLALAAAVLGPVATAPPSVAAPGLIYDNGGLNPVPLSSSGVAAPGGSYWSELQHAGGVSNGAYGYALGTGVRMADDFTVPVGQRWTIDAVQTYVARYTPSTPEPWTDGTLRIWSGRPGDPGSVPVFGDTTADRLIDSVSTKTYRIGDTTSATAPAPTSTTQLILRNTYEVSPALSLDPGTYWVDWDLRNPGGLAPAVTVPGQRTRPGWNARRFADQAWSDVVDTGDAGGVPANVAPQDLPFVLVGATQTTTPPPGPATGPAAPSAAPDTAIGQAPAKRTAKRKAVFTLTSTTPGASFQCSLNGAALAPCGPTVKVRAKKGKNTFAARAVAGGVVDASPATYTWKLKKKRAR